MEITEKDFSRKFLYKFTQEYRDCIISFCNTFARVFPEILSKDEIIERISSLKRIEEVELGEKNGNHSAVKRIIQINSQKRFNKNEKKAAIYHELMRALSMHTITKEDEKVLIQEGLSGDGMKEMMTEYFATQLIKAEGIKLDGKYYTYKRKNPAIVVYVEYEGIGNNKISPLGKAYIEIFGKEIVDGYFKNAEKFWYEFDDRYKALEARISPYIDTELSLHPTNTEQIYIAYNHALKIFGIREQHKFKNGIDVFEYLKDSKRIKDCLPKKIDASRGKESIHAHAGIPKFIEAKMAKLDEQFVLQYLRPDLVGEQKDPRKIAEKHRYNIIVNGIRDNIGKLQKGDLDQISFEEISGISTDTIVIDANGVIINAFHRNGSYLGADNAIARNRQGLSYTEFREALKVNGTEQDNEIKGNIAIETEEKTLSKMQERSEE